MMLLLSCLSRKTIRLGFTVSKTVLQTIWERWNSYIAETGTFGDVSMNSFNHYSYGAIGQWFFTDILGIRPVEFGYKSFMLSPKFGGGLTYAKGSFTSPYGKISSAWKLHDGKFTYDCTVPTNTTATLKLPNGDIHTLVGGSYHFEINVRLLTLRHFVTPLPQGETFHIAPL